MAKSALVIGSTGATGTLITHKLIKSDEYSKIYIVHPVQTPFWSCTKVKEIVGAFDNLDAMLNDVPFVDDVFSCIGSTLKKAGSIDAFYKIDCSYVLALGRWAKDRGVSSFHVISFFGADPKAINYYNRTKGLMEEGLKQMKLKSLSVYHPSLLVGRKNVRAVELAGYALLIVAKPLLVGSLRKYRPLHVKKLANAMFANSQSFSGAFQVVGSEDLQFF